MITHIVLFQPKAESTEKEITLALQQVRELQQTIPGIFDVQVGKNLSQQNQGYTYGFVMRFINTEHLRAYTSHPAHQVVSRELQRVGQNIIDFDIEQ